MTTRTLFALGTLVLLAVSLPACSSGYLYKDAPPMEFSEFDYTFPTTSALTDPSIAYIDRGTGPHTIVLVHGLASNAGFWRYVIGPLSQSYRVIAVDLPGYGKSGKGDYPYGMTFYAETITRLLDHLGLKQVVYAGHSMGGQIGITLALRHPERISRLVLVSPAGIEKFDRGEGEWLRHALSIEGVKGTPEDGIRRNLAMNFHDWDDRWEWMVEERTRMAKAREMDEFSYTVVKCVGGMLDEPTSDLLGKITQPTMIVYGKYDGLIPNPYLHPGFAADVFQGGARKIPDCRIREIDRAGHMVQIERPGEVSEAILQFVR